jgi:hypothetical protein
MKGIYINFNIKPSSYADYIWNGPYPIEYVAFYDTTN